MTLVSPRLRAVIMVVFCAAWAFEAVDMTAGCEKLSQIKGQPNSRIVGYCGGAMIGASPIAAIMIIWGVGARGRRKAARAAILAGAVTFGGVVAVIGFQLLYMGFPVGKA